MKKQILSFLLLASCLFLSSCEKTNLKQFDIVGSWQITSTDDLRLDKIVFLDDGTFELSGLGVMQYCKNGLYKYESEKLYLTCYEIYDATGSVIYTDNASVTIYDNNNIQVKSNNLAYVFYDGFVYDLEKE